MNLRFIEAFVWVPRLHSFTAASEKLHTTQTAISSRIALLESDFGVKLFERDKRTGTLEQSGKADGYSQFNQSRVVIATNVDSGAEQFLCFSCL
jgi:hypothetical protein